MSAIFNTLRLWVGVRREQVLVLAPGDGGMPEPIEDHTPMIRARYLGPDGVEQQLETRADLLDETNSSLLIRTGDSEAPPSVTALLFAPEGGENDVGFRLGGHTKRVKARLYLAATTSGTTWVWYSDFVQGKLGYFVTGMLNQRTVWRVRRVETGFAKRLIFTIQPLTLPNGLPSIDASSVKNADIRQEVEQHWREFTEVFLRGLPYRTVNAAKDLRECLLLDTLVAAGHLQLGNRDFMTILQKLRAVIENERRSTKKSVPFSDLH